MKIPENCINFGKAQGSSRFLIAINLFKKHPVYSTAQKQEVAI